MKSKERQKVELSIIAICIDPEEPIFDRFVSSLRQYTTCNYELILIDNFGDNKTLSSKIQNNADKYIRTNERLSVAKAWNIGIKASQGKYVLITNDDVVIPRDWFDQMKESFKILPQVGMVVPVMNYGPMEQTHIGTIWQKDIACPMMLTPFKSIVWGVFMLFKREALDKVQMFSEEYDIAGGEDLDMCFKIYDSKLNIGVDHRVFVYHEWGSTGKRIHGPRQRENLYKKNFAKFMKKWPEHTKHWR